MIIHIWGFCRLTPRVASVSAAKVKYNFNSDDEDEASSGEEELFDNDAVKEPDHVIEMDSDLDTSAVKPPPPARSVLCWWEEEEEGRGVLECLGLCC